MSKSKIYSVRIGRTTGIKMTWAGCKEAVDGYPGAKYKSFPREQIGAAKAYLNQSAATISDSPTPAQTMLNIASFGIAAMQAGKRSIEGWKDIQQCPPPPFKPVNVLYENPDGELQLWPSALHRKPDMTWWQGSYEVPKTAFFRYYSLIPEIPEK